MSAIVFNGCSTKKKFKNLKDFLECPRQGIVLLVSCTVLLLICTVYYQETSTHPIRHLRKLSSM